MRRFAIIVGVGLVFCVLLAWPGGPASDVIAGLAFGWLAYPARVFPEIRVAWDGVATGVLCLALFTVGLHRMLTWFYGEVRKAGGAAEGRRPWSPRWTASLVALIVLMFAVGVSATGVVHQAGWLIAARRSLVETKETTLRYGWGSSVNHLKQIGMASYALVLARDPSVSGKIPPKAEVIDSWMTEILPDL